jgi:NADH dehydrogenase FAD-containing subunit
VVPERYRSLASPAQVHLVERGDVVLAPFSARAHAYAAKRLEHDGVHLHLDVGVTEVFPDRVTLTDGTEIITRSTGRTRDASTGGRRRRAPRHRGAGRCLTPLG